ncbi:hypothetical protein PFICI_00523 [Pestalotiopsis fici W106-1]|uniref:NmrA-like domain-containing protein n=1 Tax=Pestalotiopsis fici (strain W106-1 / CGMCC3.15140) TaxID=1229662 RepID=W3XL29_PESFW|nr:uncharacterized protein PFICI_00523 [Pestalotiopsis fici W106-1]ETS86695.1 hypothetical protein PFICI_00523 [Pestalotiopsis fici W106-1]
MSKNVAIAGAGGLGRHVVNALLESKEFNVTVLSRSPKPDLEAKGANVKVVDYRYPSQLIAALEGIDTLLSFIVDFDDSKEGSSLGALAHRNLLTAAVSPRVNLRRFVPAEYANNVAGFPRSALSCERDKPHFRNYVRAFCPARGIEYTLISNGVLMDFFRPRGDKSGFPDLEAEIIPLDADKKTALIPGNGKKDKISFTAARDVARCLVALLKVPAGGWEEYSYISGDRLTWDEAADQLEAALGAKLARTHVGLEELRARAEQARKGGNFMDIMIAELNEVFGDGSEVLPENNKYFDGIKFQKLADVFQECYGKGARK